MATDDSATLSNLINNIKNQIDVDTNLAALKLFLGAQNSTQLKTLSSSVPLDLIFDCLDSENKAQLTSACEILTLILPTLPANAILANPNVSLQLAKCMEHKEPDVLKMALGEFSRHVSTDEMTMFLMTSEGKDVIMSIVKCLSHDETSIGLRSAHFISNLGQSNLGTSFLCQPDVTDLALNSTKYSETHRIRLYQALVEISVGSSDSLRHIEAQGYFRDLISSMKSDDILANLTILEVITPLTLCWHGYDFLSRHKIIKLLADVLDTVEDHSLKTLFYPGLVRFFGNLGQNYVQNLMEDQPKVLPTIFKMTESIEENIFITSLETIGMIAHSPSGKNLLMTEPAMSACMKRVYAAITQVSTDWKVRGLGALSNIVHVEPKDTKSDFAAVVQSWFEDMGPHGIDTVSEMARQPFPDIKVAALEVLIQMAPMKWGQTKIASNQALLDYLGNSEDAAATAHSTKVKLLKVLAESDSSSGVFGEEVYCKIKLGADEVKANGSTVLVEMMSI